MEISRERTTPTNLSETHLQNRSAAASTRKPRELAILVAMKAMRLLTDVDQCSQDGTPREIVESRAQKVYAQIQELGAHLQDLDVLLKRQLRRRRPESARVQELSTADRSNGESASPLRRPDVGAPLSAAARLMRLTPYTDYGNDSSRQQASG